MVEVLDISASRVLTLCVVLCAMLFASGAIVCGTDVQCRNHVPTVHNMLNSTTTAPYITVAFCFALFIHLILSAFIYIDCRKRAYYWCALQLVCAVLMYVCMFVTLFVLPATGWTNNWANIPVLVFIALWMLCSNVALSRARTRRRCIGTQIALDALFGCCALIYIVVRAVPTLEIPNKDAGILVVEVVGGLAVLAYLCLCIYQVRNAGMTMSGSNDCDDDSSNEEYLQ